MNGMWIGSKCKTVKVASQKRITKLINVQVEMDWQATATIQKQKISNNSSNPCENPQLQLFAPNSEGLAPRLGQITQDKDDEEEETLEIRRSQRLRNQKPIQVQSPQGMAAISKNAVYSVLGNTFLENLPQFYQEYSKTPNYHSHRHQTPRNNATE